MSSAWKGHQLARTKNVGVLLPVCPAAALVFCAGCSPAPDAPLDSGHQALRTEVYAALNKRSNTLPQRRNTNVKIPSGIKLKLNKNYKKTIHTNEEQRSEIPTAQGHYGNTIFDPSYTHHPTPPHHHPKFSPELEEESKPLGLI